MAPILALLLLLAADPAVAPACPPQGDATAPEVRSLNILRNRSDPPSDPDIDETATLEEILEPGPDQERWSDTSGVEVQAYLLAVTDAGLQSADCHRGREIRLDLGPNPSALDGGHRFVAVLTPAWRSRMAARGADWSPDALLRRYQGRLVRVRGWFLYDSEAQARSLNTAEDAGADIRRATAWEIHPVTSISLDRDLPEVP